MRHPNPPSTNLETLRRMQDHVIRGANQEELSDARLADRAQRIWHTEEELETNLMAQELIRSRRIIEELRQDAILDRAGSTRFPMRS